MNHVFSVSKSRNFNSSESKLDNTDVSTPFLVAPSNNRNSGATNSDGSVVNGTTVNVVEDFYWTYSKTGKKAREEVPKIILKEKRLKVNTLISQFKYAFGAAATGISGGLRDISNFAPALSFLNATAEQIESGTAAAQGVIERRFPDIVDNNNIFSRQDSYLKPYQNLYRTEVS